MSGFPPLEDDSRGSVSIRFVRFSGECLRIRNNQTIILMLILSVQINLGLWQNNGFSSGNNQLPNEALVGLKQNFLKINQVKIKNYKLLIKQSIHMLKQNLEVYFNRELSNRYTVFVCLFYLFFFSFGTIKSF